MYHRVASPAVDPWGLAVHPDRFEAQLAELRRRRHPLPISDFVRKLERGALPDDAVAVTFDDGYVDNLRRASPRLAAAQIPATLFLTTGAIGQRTDYWWDELARGIFGFHGTLDCEVDVGDERRRLTFSGADESRSPWRAWENPRTERETAYLEIWRKLRDMPSLQRDATMSRLREVLGIQPADLNDVPMTPADLSELVSSGRFEIGGHTVTHPVLPALEPAERRREILEGRRACERLVNKPVDGFAYPHGALDADTREAVRECGFRWACSTRPRPVTGWPFDRYALPRLFIMDWDGPRFARELESACAVAAEATA
jgi:peptidoglycan/xylan/chitin deacetylase (PgdA/CDA1 family)